ncbi:kelch-like protein 24 [Glandiceps talaboti]
MNGKTDVEESHALGCEDKLDRFCLDFSDMVYTQKLVSGFYDLWENGLFTDVVLDVKGQKFKCHRIVLVASSPYFRAMFTGGMRESFQKVVVINAIEPDTMERILRFIYTGRVRITRGNALVLIQAAGLFQIETLMEACASFLQGELEPGNCIGIYLLALMSVYTCQTLTQVARNFILKNFTDVSSGPEFIQLPLEQLKDILNDKELVFLRGTHLIGAVTRWLNADIECRKRNTKELSDILERRGIYELNDISQPQIHRHEIVKSVYPSWQPSSMTNTTNDRKISQSSNYEVFLCFGKAWIRSQGKSKNDAVKCYDPITNEFYGLKSEPGNVAATEFSTACQVGDKVIVGLRTGKFLSYTPKKGTWDVLSKYLLTPLCGQMMVNLDNDLYICGDSGKFHRYDQETNLLDPKEDMISPVKSGCVVAAEGKVYVIGGKICGDLYAQGTTLVQCYDPNTNQWKLCNPIPDKCTSVTAALLNGLIYVIGTDCCEHLQSTKKVLRYNPTTDTWCRVADLNKSRQSSSAVVCNGKLYVTGGFNVSQIPEDVPVREIECYDPATDEWSIVDDLPIDIAFHQCVSVPVSQIKPINATEK